jgi:hypothetical protein
MQLRTARLCLDCEELHDQEHCPVCASEAFAFLTRWVPVDDRREQRRRPTPPPPRPNGMKRLAKGGAFALAAVATGRWLWTSTRPQPQPQKDIEKKERPLQ